MLVKNIPVVKLNTAMPSKYTYKFLEDFESFKEKSLVRHMVGRIMSSEKDVYQHVTGNLQEWLTIDLEKVDCVIKDINLVNGDTITINVDFLKDTFAAIELRCYLVMPVMVGESYDPDKQVIFIDRLPLTLYLVPMDSMYSDFFNGASALQETQTP